MFELDKNDYKNWAKGLKQAGYATNPRYPDMLINTIEKYQLNQYDQPESEPDKIKREDRVFTEINANIPKETKKFTPVETPPSRQVINTTSPDYTVQKGDTLYNIAKRYNMTVDELKALNSLTEDGVKIGQKLIVVK